MIRMINNTKNGYADAYSESEAVDFEAKGWARFVEPEKTVIADIEPVAADKPKRGRPFKVEE
jgi:hypothetical protein